MSKVRKIRLVLLLTGVGTALLSLLFIKLSMATPAVIFLILAAVCCIGELVYNLIFWRCPSCGRLLPIKGFLWSQYCPRCGEYLEE